ncbi:MAG: N-acetyl-gamma-glutamyl-phosphate reductase [Synergistales bacterium]|nr:N-acetyl-gamma-glutamyl-phosphate reductase [Synergistales bacterium]
MYRVVLWGANGMAGGEMLRLIAGHPDLELVAAVSRSKAGSPIWHVHPHLRQEYSQDVFINPEEAFQREADLVFLALPHGSSWQVILPYLEKGVKVVDLSADARLKDPDDYIRWYEKSHGAPEILTESVYGLPELHREEIRNARLVSGVGCNATCSIIGLYPLAFEGLIAEARLDLRVGSSEGGASPTRGSHHPYRDRTLRVYEPFRHRHLAEIIQELKMPEQAFTMTMTAASIVRGVQMLGQIRLTRKLREAELWKVYRRYFAEEPFVSLCPAKPSHLRFPDPRFVVGSNRAMTGFALHEDSERLIVVTAIDNLLKGAAGSALQSANLMLGLDEKQGLEMVPLYPV